LGNTDRADDGVGVIVAEALKERFPSSSFSEHDGVEGVVLDISERAGDATVFFVDAASMAGNPGEIRVVRREDIGEAEITTHRVTVALMASLLERSGKRSAVVCVKPANADFGGQVSPAVSASAELLIRVFAQMLGSMPKAR